MPEARHANNRADEPRFARLIVTEGPTAGAVFSLDRSAIVLGRSDPTHGVFPDIDLSAADSGETPSLSRRHAEILGTSAGFAIRDLGSANGTSVNGSPVPGPSQEPRSLRNGDSIRIGRVELRVILADQAERKEAEGSRPVEQAPLGRRPAMMAAICLCTVVLGMLVISWAAPGIHARMLAIPDRLTDTWTPRSCAAFPEACRTALDAKLAGQIGELDALATRLADALRRTEMALGEREARLADLQRRGKALRASRTTGRFPVTVDGETFPSPAILDGRLLSMAETERALTTAVAEARILRGDLVNRRVATLSRRAEAQSQRDLLPVHAARRAAEATLSTLASAQAGVAALLRDALAEKDAADPLLRNTEELLRR